MNFFTFPSIMRPDEIGYTAHSDSTLRYHDVHRTNRPLDNWCWAFQTYGDGCTQHSGDWPVQWEDAADYLGSMAVYLHDAAPSHREECLQLIHDTYCFKTPAVDEREAWFAMTKVIYKDDGKRRWYSLNECKISTNSAKQHDKRWEEVPVWADGTFDGVCNLLSKSFYRALQRYALARQIEELFRHPAFRDKRYASHSAAEDYMQVGHLENSTKQDTNLLYHRRYQLSRAYGAIEGMIKARSDAEWGKRQAETFVSEHERFTKQQAEEKAKAAREAEKEEASA